MLRYTLLLVLFLCQQAFATGPSRAILKITPLSINEEGALLYKYKMISNPMGGHVIDDIFYGIGSVKKGQFTYIKQHIMYNNRDDLDYNKYKIEEKELNEWLNTPCKQSDLISDFTSCNLNNHFVDRLMSVAEIKRTYGVDVTTAPNYFLLPGKMKADKNALIHVSYAINGLIIAEFENYSTDCEGIKNHATVFIAQGFIHDLNDLEINERNNFDENNYYAFDCYDATGVIQKD